MPLGLVLRRWEVAKLGVLSTLAGYPALMVGRAAVSGKDGVGEPVSLIGGSCLVSAMLNAFDMSVPGSDEGLG